MLNNDGKVTVEEHDLVETFNDHYINIVEKYSEEKPRNFVPDKFIAFNEIVQHYNIRPSIIKIRGKFGNSQNTGKFQFNSVTTPEILKLLKNIEDNKVEVTNKILRKLVKLSATVLSQQSADSKSNSIYKGVFPGNAKVTSVFLLESNRMIKIRAQILEKLLF